MFLIRALIFHQILVSECQNIQVILQNEILSKHEWLEGLEGSYQLDQIVNGRSSWISVSSAIWFIPDYNEWAIGKLGSIGTNWRSITAHDG